MSRFSCLLILAVGCGSSPDPLVDAPPAPDAPPAGDAPPPDGDAPPRVDLSCLGQSVPSVVPDPLPIAGKVFAFDHYNAAQLAGATVELRARASDAILASATTDREGAFALSIASNGAPVAATLVVTAPGFLPTRADPGESFAASETLENVLLGVTTEDELARWASDAGVSHAAGDRVLVTATVDCARQAVAGATLAVAPPGAVTYYDARAKHWDPVLAASTNGFALVTGSAGQLSATASAASEPLPTRTLAVEQGVLTLAVLTPRVP